MDRTIDVSVFDDQPVAGPVKYPVRPWARYVAKSIDIAIITFLTFFVFFVIGIVIAVQMGAGQTPFIDLAVLEGPFAALISFAIFLPLFWLLEATCISLTGSTPGKSLMGFSVRKPDGRRLSWLQSLSRSFGALLIGLGLMIPIISLITMVRHYQIYVSEGASEWDDDGSIAFMSRPVHGVRWVIGVLIVALERIISVGLSVLPQLIEAGG